MGQWCELFACVVSGYLMSHDCFVDTTCQELILHSIHCSHTSQLHYQIFLNMATIMQIFGEFPIAEIIRNTLSHVTEKRNDGLF